MSEILDEVFVDIRITDVHERDVGLADLIQAVYLANLIDIWNHRSNVVGGYHAVPDIDHRNIDKILLAQNAVVRAFDGEGVADGALDGEVRLRHRGAVWLRLHVEVAVAEAAGLQWVNSDVEKMRASQAAMADEHAPARVPRERKPVASVDNGPLVLVETRKDLSQIKLPFESSIESPRSQA